MKNMRLAIILAACCALLSPGFAAAGTWNQIKGAKVDVGSMNTPVSATNIPAGGKDNIDVYGVFCSVCDGSDQTIRVASCGPAMGTNCPPATGGAFTGWVHIGPTTDLGTGFTVSAVGWGTQRYVFASFGMSEVLAFATRNGKTWSN